jgi:hypothetical protein
MSISPLPAREPRSTALLGQLRDVLAQLDELECWQLGDGELISTTEDLYRHLNATSARALRFLGEIDARGLAPDAGSPSTAAWLKARLNMNHGPARRQVTLAKALRAHPVTAHHLGDGAVIVDQAVVITSALDALPGSVLPETVAAAEQTLIQHAADLTPQQLTRLAQRLHLALDPDGPQPEDHPTPDPGYYLNLQLNDDGSCQGQFWLSPALGLRLAGLVDAAAAPRPSSAEGHDPRTAGRRRHDALADLVHLAVAHPDPVPGAGRATVAVTVSLEDLRAGLPGLGPDETVIDAATVRQMACDAAIIPIVLGSKSEVLDIGRRSKKIPAKIRRALNQRDKGCAFPGCDRSLQWVQAHHIKHWAHGGITALVNLVLLCRHHHGTIHHRGWSVHIDKDGIPRFTAPAWLRAA